MNKETIIEILENEINCVKAAEYCTRECNKCFLVKKPEDIINALTVAIKTLEKNYGID